MSDDPNQTTGLVPCMQPARYDRGECGWPVCGCSFPVETDPGEVEAAAKRMHAVWNADGRWADYTYPWEHPLAAKEMFRVLARAALEKAP